MSDLELPMGETKPDDDDASCMFCQEMFTNDRRGEFWIRCIMCSLWAHNACADAGKNIYVCDFCK